MKRMIVAIAILGAVSAVAFARQNKSHPKRGRESTSDVRRQNLIVPSAKPGPRFPSRAQQLAKELQRLSKYQATVALPNPRTTGQELLLQREIADEFAKLDLFPVEREEHFRWINDLFDDDEDDLDAVVGWQVVVHHVVPSEDGWLVTAIVKPLLNLARGGVATDDFSEERYLYDRGGLHYLGSVERPGVPRIFTIN
ncbi:MAG TPA: hypothetical protein VFT74_16850 [Isosphaeraceae bacterium]|nr:hypothetical protein [Isosphaeraceae bacterium]